MVEESAVGERLKDCGKGLHANDVDLSMGLFRKLVIAARCIAVGLVTELVEGIVVALRVRLVNGAIGAIAPLQGRRAVVSTRKCHRDGFGVQFDQVFDHVRVGIEPDPILERIEGSLGRGRDTAARHVAVSIVDFVHGPASAHQTHLEIADPFHVIGQTTLVFGTELLARKERLEFGKHHVIDALLAE